MSDQGHFGGVACGQRGWAAAHMPNTKLSVQSPLISNRTTSSYGTKATGTFGSLPWLNLYAPRPALRVESEFGVSRFNPR